MAYKIKDVTSVAARVSALQPRFEPMRRAMERLDPFRHMDEPRAKHVIWNYLPEDTRRVTTMLPHLASSTDTTVAFLASDSPTILCRPKSFTSGVQDTDSNFVEGLGYNLWYTIEKYREEPILMEAAEFCVHRGVIVGQVLWLSPKERGEERGTRPILASDGSGEVIGEEAYITKQGRFPLFWKIIDPLDCLWVRGADGRTIEFIHKFKLPFEVLCDTFPELEKHGRFRSMNRDMHGSKECLVTDYWNEEIHCVVIDDVMIKAPSPHNYPRCPVVIELAKPRQVRYSSGEMAERMGTPYCDKMYEPVRAASYAESLYASYLEEQVFATIVHKGIPRTPGQSPYWVKDPKTGKSKYNPILNLGPGARIFPLFENEALEYLRGPELNNQVERYVSARLRDAMLVSYHEGILSGALNADVSGYSFNQQKQATLARTEPYRISLDRWASGMVQLSFDVTVSNWDRGNDVEMTMLALVGEDEAQQEDEQTVTRAMFESIGSVQVVVRPKVPINEDEDWTRWLTGMNAGVASRRKVIEKLNIARDPDAELKRIAFETEAFANPVIRLKLAVAHMVDTKVATQEEAEKMLAAAGIGGQPAMGQPAMGQPAMGQPAMAGQPGAMLAQMGLPQQAIDMLVQQFGPEYVMQLEQLPPEQLAAELEAIFTGGGTPAPAEPAMIGAPA